MTTHLKLSTTAAAALIAFSSCSSNRLFNQMDADGDSQITSAEYANQLQRSAFDEIDTNNDTFLDSAEWRKVETTNQSGTGHYGLDTNKDGKVSLREFKDSVAKRDTFTRAFETADKNKDGSLDQQELNQGGMR